MQRQISLLRCPYSGSTLRLESGYLDSGERKYPVVDGVPWLLEEKRVAAIDQHFQRQYGEHTARKYDIAIKFQSLLLGCWEPAQRQKMVRLLAAPTGGRVLEVAVGTGANLPLLQRAVGPGGEIVCIDLSVAMMRVAQRRARSLPLPIHFIRADACHLPFADDSFDAVFHFGGLNMFGDIRKALSEMVRVAKPGAPIVTSDEGMSEARRQTLLGRQLGRRNTLNLCRPPFAQMDWDSVTHFELHWAWRELFYVMCFRKAEREMCNHKKSTELDGAELQPKNQVAQELAKRTKCRSVGAGVTSYSRTPEPLWQGVHDNVLLERTMPRPFDQ